MCGLFGFIDLKENTKDYSKLLNKLSLYASERGIHATGIAYNYKNKLTIYKKPLPAEKVKFEHFSDVKIVMGHTRHATQGNYTNNINNHPFKGVTKKEEFALAHNGVIYNDKELQITEKIKSNKIKTDSFIMVQLLEKQKQLNFENIAECVEKLEGYYTFTILDNSNNLFIVKGDSPITILKMKKSNIIVYASTDEILLNALIDSGFADEISNGDFEKIKINDGDILKISQSGNITKGKFEPYITSYFRKNWYDYNFIDTSYIYDNSYYEDIVSIAKGFGFTKEDIDNLLDDGFSLEDIEEFIYSGDYEYATSY